MRRCIVATRVTHDETVTRASLTDKTAGDNNSVT